jgi:hypothetical protein
LSENGVIAPSLEYPVVYGDGLLGVGATNAIGALKGFLYIPQKIMITE